MNVSYSVQSFLNCSVSVIGAILVVVAVTPGMLAAIFVLGIIYYRVQVGCCFTCETGCPAANTCSSMLVPHLACLKHAACLLGLLFTSHLLLTHVSISPAAFPRPSFCPVSCPCAPLQLVFSACCLRGHTSTACVAPLEVQTCSPQTCQRPAANPWPSTDELASQLCSAMQVYYIATSRELKRLDSLALSPIFGNFNESLQGLLTLRAFRKQDQFMQRNHRLLNDSNRVWWPIQVIILVSLAGSNSCSMW